MREILFRGKRTENGEWVEGNLFIPDLPNTPTQICIGTNVIRITYDIIPETVGEFTGLIDPHGERIFEGDVVMLIFESDKHKGKVVFYNGGFCVHTLDTYVSLQHCPAYKFELLGNIHDNPELLGGPKNEQSNKKRN